MNIAMRAPPMTRDQFFDWAEAQNGRYEFDGREPVAIVGTAINQDRMVHSIFRALGARIAAGNSEVLDPDAGVATIHNAVRNPDAVVARARSQVALRLVADPVVVFEVLSPSSERIDRFVRVQEYAAVPSILRDVIAEHTFMSVTALSREAGATHWTPTPVGAEDTLIVAEFGIEVPVVELYAGTDVPASDEVEATPI